MRRRTSIRSTSECTAVSSLPRAFHRPPLACAHGSAPPLPPPPTCRDLDYVKDQITITEVSVARLYNHDVQRKRAMKAVAA